MYSTIQENVTVDLSENRGAYMIGVKKWKREEKVIVSESTATSLSLCCWNMAMAGVGYYQGSHPENLHFSWIGFIHIDEQQA